MTTAALRYSWQNISCLATNTTHLAPDGDNQTGSGERGEEAEDEVANGLEAEEDRDAVQQDRRASHAQASTREGSEPMPDVTDDAGQFMLLTSFQFFAIDKIGELQASSSTLYSVFFPLWQL